MRGRKKAGYGNVYKDILSNPNLSLQAKGLYAYLSSFTGDQEYCFPSYDTMQIHLKISRASLSKYIKELIAFGVVQVNKRFTGSNQYYLTDLGDFKHDSSNNKLPKVQILNCGSSNNELPKVQILNSIKNTSLRTPKKNTIKKKSPIYFKDSEIATKEAFVEYFKTQEGYKEFNHDFYYEKIARWGIDNKRKDWKKVSKNWMNRDDRPKLKNSSNNQESKQQARKLKRIT